jgi:hypothetical protein
MARMTERPSAPSKTGEVARHKIASTRKNPPAILIQLDREVVSIGDNFSKILKLRDRSYVDALLNSEL